MLAHQLIQPAIPEQAVPVLIDVHAVGWAGSPAVEEHVVGNWLLYSWREHEMRVACVEPVGDGPAGPLECDILTLDRPLTSEGPIVQLRCSGSL